MSKLWDMWLMDLREPIPEQPKNSRPRKKRKKSRRGAATRFDATFFVNTLCQAVREDRVFYLGRLMV